MLCSCFPTSASKYLWISPFSQDARYNPMTLKASFTKKIAESDMKRKLKEENQENMKRKRLRFSSLRRSPMQKCQGKISKHRAQVTNMLKVSGTPQTKMILKWSVWAHNRHLTQTTHFTDEDQGNHSQSQSYKQVLPSPWILWRTEAR